MGKLIDLTGRTFGRLTVIGRYPSNTSFGEPRWRCCCDCGEATIVGGADLRNGNTKSCGCLRREVAAERARGAAEWGTTHGQAVAGHQTSEYRCWAHIKDRCLTKRNESYPNYGGRGIDMDPRWIGSFEAFFADVGPKPSPDLSIDRIDNERGYWPGNVRWATKAQQQQNRRRPRKKVA